MTGTTLIGVFAIVVNSYDSPGWMYWLKFQNGEYAWVYTYSGIATDACVEVHDHATT